MGGGGLITGCTVAAKGLNPDIQVIGVEAALYPSMQRALEGGEQVIGGQTIADGIAVKAVSKTAVEMARSGLSNVLAVTEAEIEQAIVLYLEIEKTVSEGAGATPLAALLAHPELFRGRNCGLIISSGNIDSRLLSSVISRGLVRQGRIVSLRIEITDQPGALAQIATVVGDAGANIIEVAHHRLFSDVPVKGADLDLLIETRDPEHGREVVARITAAGYTVTQMSITAAGGAS